MWKTSESFSTPAQAVIIEGPPERAAGAARAKAARHIGAKAYLIDEGAHPDVREESGAAGAGQAGRVRALCADAFVRPFMAEKKVYIITNADELSEHSQNALLKTLEEPPPYAYFYLLCADANALLATVRSRCVTVKLPPASAPPREELAAQARKWLAAMAPERGSRKGAETELAVCAVVMGWQNHKRDDFFELLWQVYALLREELTSSRPERLPREKVFALLGALRDMAELQAVNPSVPALCGEFMRVCAEG
ncbi:MAG: hypothetical protein LBI44_05440 [Oscillospiraceae bacterium]|jgi:hypothetical protein|nr:hypothetical protein [Oscillospiraceae bacterium]